MKNKKTIITIAIIILLIIAGVIIFLFIKNQQKQTPMAKVEGKMAEYIMQTAGITADNEWVYYYSSQETPAFYRFNLNNQKTEQISEELQDIQMPRFSPDFNYAIFQVIYDGPRFKQYGSPFLNPPMEDGEQRFWTYNFKDKKLSYLDKNITNAVFSVDSNKLIYSYQYVDGKVKINQSDIDGKNYGEIADWGYREANIYPIDSNLIYLSYASDTDDSAGGVYSLKIKEKELNLIDNKKFSSIFSLSPSKKKILFIKPEAINNQIQTSIWSSDLSLKNYTTINTDKNLDYLYNNVIWNKNENYVFIAARQTSSENYERIYRINLEEKTQNLFLEEKNSNFEPTGISADGNYLYYLLNSQLYVAKI